MKKRLFAALACIILVLTMVCTVPVVAFAEEAVPGETVSTETESGDELVTEPAESETPAEPSEPAPEGESTYHTLFTRIWEYVNANSTEVIGMAGDIAIFILAIFVKLRNDKKTKSIAKDLATVKTETTQTLGGQDSVVEVVNNLIEAYNGLSADYQKLKESYDTYGATEGDRNRVVGALVAQNTAILEILTTVYVNSKNLPQGVKDLVNLKYANCLKSLEDDEQLKAIVEAVRSNIGATMTTETTEAVTDNAEV